MRFPVLLVLCLMALLFACAKKPAIEINPAPVMPLPPRDVPTAGTHSPVESTEVADFSIGLQRYSPRFVENQWRAYQATHDDDLTVNEHRELLIDELILARALDRDPAGSDPVFQAQVIAAQRRMKARHYIEEVLWRDIIVTDLEVETRWRVQRQRFTEPEQARIHQLQFQTVEEARESYELAVKGNSFADIAEARGLSVIDPGWISRGQLDRRLEDIAFDLEIGEVSNVVSTESGHWLMTRVGTIPPRQLPLEEVAPQIREELLAVRRAEAVRDFLERRRQDEHISGDPVLIP